jgi:hypothetical protein
MRAMADALYRVYYYLLLYGFQSILGTCQSGGRLDLGWLAAMVLYRRAGRLVWRAETFQVKGASFLCYHASHSRAQARAHMLASAAAC